MSVNATCKLASTCMICQQRVQLSLKLWPCMHTFCPACLQQWEPSYSMGLPNKSACIMCPVCDQPALLQGESDALPGNVSLNNPGLSSCHKSRTVSRVEVQEEARRKKDEVRMLLRTIQDELNKRRHYLEDQIDFARDQAACYCDHRVEQLNESMRMLANFAEGLSELMNLSFGCCDDICEIELTEFIKGVEKVVSTTAVDPNEPIPIATPQSFRLPGIDPTVLVDALVLETDLPLAPKGYYDVRGGHKVRSRTYSNNHPGTAYGEGGVGAGGATAVSCPSRSCHVAYSQPCGFSRQWGCKENPCQPYHRSCFGPRGLNNSSDVSENAWAGAPPPVVLVPEQQLPRMAPYQTADDTAAAMAANIEMEGAAPIPPPPPPPTQEACGEPVLFSGSLDSRIDTGRLKTSDVGETHAAGSSAVEAGCIDPTAPGEWLGALGTTNDRDRVPSSHQLRQDPSDTQSNARPGQAVLARRRVHASCPVHGARPNLPLPCSSAAETYSITVQESTPVLRSGLDYTDNSTCSAQPRSGSLPPATQPSDQDPMQHGGVVEVRVEEAQDVSMCVEEARTLPHSHPFSSNEWVLDTNRSARSLSDTTIASSAVGKPNFPSAPTTAVPGSSPNIEDFPPSAVKFCRELKAVENDEEGEVEYLELNNETQRLADKIVCLQSREEPHAAGVMDPSMAARRRSMSSLPRPPAGHQKAAFMSSFSTLVIPRLRRLTVLPPLAETSRISSRRDSPKPTLGGHQTDDTKMIDAVEDGLCQVMLNMRRRRRNGNRNGNSMKVSSRLGPVSLVKVSPTTKRGRNLAQSDREKPVAGLVTSDAPPTDSPSLCDDEKLHAHIEVDCKVVLTDIAPLLSLTWNAVQGTSQFKVSMHDLGMVEVGGARERGVASRGVFLVETFTTETAVTLQHGQFEHTYAVTVSAFAPNGVAIACSLPTIFRLPCRVHFEHVRFDPQACHCYLVNVDASLHSLHRRDSSSPCRAGREERCPRPSSSPTPPGSLDCLALPLHTLGTVYWECRVHLKVLLPGKSCGVLCSVGVCEAGAVPQNSACSCRSLCATFLGDGLSVVLRFWDGWRRSPALSHDKAQVVEVENHREASVDVGFLLLSKRALVLVDVGEDAILHQFQLPKREVEWIPAASLSDQEVVSASVCWLQPQVLPDCLLDMVP